MDDREGSLTRDGGGGGMTPTNTPQGEEMEGREHDAWWSTNTPTARSCRCSGMTSPSHSQEFLLLLLFQLE